MAGTGEGTPRNFVIFFKEKTGSTALMSLLGGFRDVCPVTVDSDIPLEPFDRYNCGPMTIGKLRSCLELVFGSESPDMAKMNRLYLRSGRAPLQMVDGRCAVGFKMRYRPPRLPADDGAPYRWLPVGSRRRRRRRAFDLMMEKLLQRHRVVALVLIRNDLLRWALSRYHGDGSGRPGHLQFRLAAGEISEREVGMVPVDCERLATVIERSRADRDRQLALHAGMLAARLDSHVLTYEQFLHQREALVRHVLSTLGIRPDMHEWQTVMGAPPTFRKVHPDRIEDFVINHREVLARFGHLTAGP